MNRSQSIVSLVALTVLAIGLSSATAQELPVPINGVGNVRELNNQSIAEKASYILGFEIVGDMRARSVDFDLESLIRGLREASAGGRPRMSTMEIQTVLTAFNRQVQEKQRRQMQILAATNLKEGQQFLASNLKAEGVERLENGIQIKVIDPGDGPSPTAADVVQVHYKGSFIDGRVFDTSYGHEPRQYKMNEMIQGLAAAVQKMKVGGKWQVFVPSSLAYGPNGNPPIVGPNKTLVYEIELLGIGK